MIGNYTPSEPIVAIATALSPSALAIVRTSGKNCIELVSNVFSQKQKLLNADGNTIIYGWIKDDDRKIDEVLVSVFRCPKSFTGEDMIEISCHGGPSVVVAIYNLLLKNGFREAQRGEFTFRAYIHRKTDLTKAEAIREIIESRTDESRGRAAGRLAGSLYNEIDSIKKLILNTLSAIEVEVEYPEDEETIADSFDSKEIEKAKEKLQILSDTWKSEKLYQDGARVVLCGRTNAGKSSLFNALLKEDRAIVSDIEGTTRDWLESWADFDGVPVRLFDTAGIRETTDEIEKKGVELAQSLTKDADVVIYLIDREVGIKEDDKIFLTQCDEKIILAWNKCDKENKEHKENNIQIKNLYAEINISANSGDGIKDLIANVKKAITSGISTERKNAGLGSKRQKANIEEALENIESALENAKTYTLDAIVQDLEEALLSLGEITGEVTSDDVLSNIFQNFCVGK